MLFLTVIKEGKGPEPYRYGPGVWFQNSESGVPDPGVGGYVGVDGAWMSACPDALAKDLSSDLRAFR